MTNSCCWRPCCASTHGPAPVPTCARGSPISRSGSASSRAEISESEGGRKQGCAMVMTSMVSSRHAVPVSEPAEPEVTERATRRVFSAQYKLKILAEYERRDRNGRSALLRREGLYTSSISEWRRQREEGALQALKAAPGRPSTDPREHELAKLR